MGREVRFSERPKTVISTVPSQTELFSDLGIGNNVLAITSYCVHPSGWLESKPIIGGTKKLDITEILRLSPDVVIANKEENQKEQIEELARHVPVWISDVRDFTTAVDFIKSMGVLLDVEEKAQAIIQSIIQERNSITPLNKVKTLYFIWRKPYMVAGSNTFINSTLSHCGFSNIAEVDTYDQISHHEMVRLNPEFILLSSEPFPFAEKHKEEISEILPNAKVILVDGEMFSWYGSRMSLSFQYFQNLVTELK